MKLSRTNLISLAGPLLALGILCGCNRLDDEDLNSAGSRLEISSVSPSAVQSDVTSGSDPNGMSTPPPDDTVTFGLTNTSQAGSGGDVLVLSYDVTCSNGTLNVTGQPIAVPIVAGATASVDVIIASGAYKESNSATLLAAGADICGVTFNGEDLGGDTVRSQEALVGVTFVDTP